jgi:hypothetical protein
LFEQFYRDVVDNVRTEVDFKTVSPDMPLKRLFDRSDRLSAHMLDKLTDARSKGLKAYYGWLDSETNPIQTFFCTDCFEVQNQKIYFNGLENVW